MRRYRSLIDEVEHSKAHMYPHREVCPHRPESEIGSLETELRVHSIHVTLETGLHMILRSVVAPTRGACGYVDKQTLCRKPKPNRRPQTNHKLFSTRIHSGFVRNPDSTPKSAAPHRGGRVGKSASLVTNISKGQLQRKEPERAFPNEHSQTTK